KGEAEAYTFVKKDNSKVCYYNGSSNRAAEDNLVVTYGLRGSMEPIANATLAAEAAYQAGRYSVTTNEIRSRNAYAIDVSGDYSFKDVKWSPKLGVEYIIYSGEEATAAGSNAGNRYEGWDPMFRGKFDTAIREFQNVYYATAMRADNAATATAVDMDSGVTNEGQLLIIGSVKPTNTLTLDGRFGWFRMIAAQEVNNSARNKDIGTELDLSLTYDYTEDVSFNLLAAWFFPGKYWIGGQDDTATDIVGTVKVAF
ncbi:MAG: alginate export family protein, partial [Candidatus Omnitrophica bacterium]|nr:alginate export family protein [Candidatus Omnitrophota bacterium]